MDKPPALLGHCANLLQQLCGHEVERLEALLGAAEHLNGIAFGREEFIAQLAPGNP